LRRRRRQSTQIIRKKSIQESSVSSYTPPPKSGGSGHKVLYFFLTISLLAVISYYGYDLSFKKDRVADQNGVVDPRSTSITADDTSADTQVQDQSASFEHKIQIEILNGCGKSGVAKIFQKYLREQGFDVLNTENYVKNRKVFWQVEKSFVIDQIGVEEQAKTVAKSLGIPVELIESRQNPNAIYDVSVVIGKDYKNLLAQ
jgi:hypothetical protein